MFQIDSALLDDLNSLYLTLDADNRIASHGRTISTVFGGRRIDGDGFFDHFDIVKPRGFKPGTAGAEVVALKVRTRGTTPSFGLSGAVFQYREDTGRPGALVMLTPGSNIQLLCEHLNLTKKDLSPIDSSGDLLYLIQTQDQLLRDALQNAERLSQAKLHAEAQAHQDWHTGLLNRRGLAAHLEKVLTKRQGCVLFHFDLDRFKKINDTYGHAAGDAVLSHVARALEHSDTVGYLAARIGGDEFVTVQEGTLSQPEITRVATEICTRVAQPFYWNDIRLWVSVTTGVAVVKPGDVITSDELMHNADLALYEGKESRRGSIHVFSTKVLDRALRLRRIAAEIAPGLERGEFVPFYQPKVDIRIGRLQGVEVLMRWKHPRRGMLTPGVFLDAMEFANLLADVDKTIRTCAMDDFQSWRAAGLNVPGISFNVGDMVLREDDMVDDLAWDATERGIPLEDITLEILESTFIDNSATDHIARIKDMRRRGFRISLDDFGTGHSSIASLLALPIGELKVDRAFIDGIARDKRLQTATDTIRKLGQNLNVEVLAEGVETIEDRDVVAGFGISLMQGYLFGRPMGAADFVEWCSGQTITRLAGGV